MSGSSLIEKLSRFPLQQVTVNGRRLSYRTAGKGPVLLLLHGISSGSGSWVSQLEQLSDRFRVVAWDAPGYGQSDALHCLEPTACDYAEAVLDLIQVLELEQPLLVGHSLGALIASAFASRYGALLDGLVLADPAQGYGSAAPSVQRDVYRQRPQMLAELGPDGLARERAPALLSSRACADKVALVADGMQRLQVEGFRAASYLLAYDDIWRYLPGYRDSLLVLCGDEDSITPPVSAIALTERFGQALYVALPQAGHASYIDAPEAFNNAVAGFSMVRRSGATYFPGGEK